MISYIIDSLCKKDLLKIVKRQKEIINAITYKNDQKVILIKLGNLKKKEFKKDKNGFINTYLVDVMILLQTTKKFKIDEFENMIIFSIVLDTYNTLIIHNKKTNENKNITITNNFNMKKDYIKYDNSNNYELSFKLEEADNPIEYKFILDLI